MLNTSTSGFDAWGVPPELTELGENEIHVWRVHLDDCDEAVLLRFEASLAPEETARANRFRFHGDRSAFVATRGILRELLGRYLKRAASQIELEYGPQGKPALRQDSSGKSVQFNVSHSHGVALLAFAIGRNVGVDVELVRPDFATQQIAERYFSAQEVSELRQLPPSVQDEGFFLCWTRKEAYIKARGEGLSIPLKSFQVSLTPGKPEHLQAPDSSQWNLRSLRPGPRHVGALVGEGQDWHVRSWHWKSGESR